MAKYLNYKDKKFSVGDTVRIHFNVKDGDKMRTQLFEGILIAVSGRETGKSFTVRKVAAGGVGVEKITPVGSPIYSDIELVHQGSVRRAKLSYLRDRIGKRATKIKKLINTATAAPVEAPEAVKEA